MAVLDSKNNGNITTLSSSALC